MNPDRLGAKFQWGTVVEVSVKETFFPETRSPESFVFIQLFGKVQVFAGLKMTFDENGEHHISGEGGVEIKPGVNIRTPLGGIQIKPDPLEESKSWKFELPKP